MQTEEKPNGGKKHECYFNEAAFGSRSAFRTSDKEMEPEDGSLHLYRAERDLYH